MDAYIIYIFSYISLNSKAISAFINFFSVLPIKRKVFLTIFSDLNKKEPKVFHVAILKKIFGFDQNWLCYSMKHVKMKISCLDILMYIFINMPSRYSLID